MALSPPVLMWLMHGLDGFNKVFALIYSSVT